ncbi:MAG: hypothetical protein QNJ30_20755 [Kiloniellales bacterium]|nr:hypothetical protein [Kiloniellales bacterium]
MSKLRLFHGVAILAAAGAAGFFLSQSQWLGASAESETLTQLQQLKQYDAALNQEALKVRSGLVQHYDPLVQATYRVADVVIALQNTETGIVGKGNRDIDQLVKQYAQLYEKRVTITERFKARNSTLRNSLFYFPTAATLFIKRAQENKAPQAMIVTTEQMLRDLLSFYVNGNPDMHDRVQKGLHELSRLSDEAPEAMEREITGLMKHASIVLRHKKQVDDMLVQITSPESLSVLDSLVHVYQEQLNSGQSSLELYRGGFYVSVTALICYLIFLIAGILRRDSGDRGDAARIAGRPVLASDRAA